MVVLGFNLQRWNILRFLRVLGLNSLPIYIMHLLVAGFVRIILIKYLPLHNATVILCCGIVVDLSSPVVIYNLLIKDGVFWFLFSPRKPVQRRPPTLDISKINALPLTLISNSFAGLHMHLWLYILYFQLRGIVLYNYADKSFCPDLHPPGREIQNDFRSPGLLPPRVLYRGRL